MTMSHSKYNGNGCVGMSPKMISQQRLDLFVFVIMLVIQYLDNSTTPMEFNITMYAKVSEHKTYITKQLH
jgi:hypothetical protein